MFLLNCSLADVKKPNQTISTFTSVMPRNIPLLLWTISILTSCNFSSETIIDENSPFKIEKLHPNGKSEIIFKQFQDTVVNGIVFSYKFKCQLDTLGQITREGYYLNDQAYGLHKFYQDNKVFCLREYELFSNEQIKLLNTIDSTTSASFTPHTTYLNSAYYLENNDTIENKSSFYKISKKHESTRIDSMMFNIEFFEPQIEIQALELYFEVPEDTSLVRIVTGNGNNIDFKQPIPHSGKPNISGFALLQGYTIDESSRDTFGATRFIRFRKELQ